MAWAALLALALALWIWAARRAPAPHAARPAPPPAKPAGPLRDALRAHGLHARPEARLLLRREAQIRAQWAAGRMARLCRGRRLTRRQLLGLLRLEERLDPRAPRAGPQLRDPLFDALLARLADARPAAGPALAAAREQHRALIARAARKWRCAAGDAGLPGRLRVGARAARILNAIQG